jgi:hypothetical protein
MMNFVKEVLSTEPHKLGIDFKKIKILKEWKTIYGNTGLGFYPDLWNQLRNHRLSMKMDSAAKNPAEWSWNPLYHVQL